MILFATAALAQDDPQWLYGACDVFAPIAGTAGWTNAREAIRTNATTYGAGEFARRRLRGRNLMAMDFHLVAGVARVPTLCSSTKGTRADEGVYMQPVDLGATNLGLRLPLLEDGPVNSGAEVFYAASVAQSAMGSRVATAFLPLFNLYPATFAPAIGRFSAGRGLFTYTLDWIGGVNLTSDIVSVQAGYTGTRGLYLDVTQNKSAVFVNGITTGLGDGFQIADLQYVIGGVEQLDPREFDLDPEARLGMPSLFYRDIASGGQLVEDGIAVPDRLKTLHLRQEDIGRLIDVRSSVQLNQRVRLRELAVGIHTDGWYRRNSLDASEDDNVSLRAGFVNLPDQPLLGVKGGIKPTIRADYVKQVDEENVFALRLSVRVNDPDVLDLYPFAYNAFGANMEMTYIGERKD